MKLKLLTKDPDECSCASVELKVKNSGLPSLSIWVMPLNPRIQPVKEFVVIPV